MTTTYTNENAGQLDELLDRWEEAQAEGRELTADELCTTAPHLLSEMRRKIAALKRVNACLTSQADQLPSLPAAAPPTAGSARVTLQGDYVDLVRLAQGGLGVVFRGTDDQLHRDVAVKFLLPHQADKPAMRDRFITEAEITGRLDHPGVVPVYGLGKTPKGQSFYVMRLIRGETLDAAIRQYHSVENWPDASQRRIALHGLLNRFAAVCKTIAYAHTRGIVHRDIKPQNIMLGKYGETLVVDWGLAAPFARDDRFRVLDEKTLLPKTTDPARLPSGSGEGTPMYMSPEQASGQGPIGPASDIFSLGVTLYELICGKAPFTGKTPIDVKRAIVAGDYRPLRRVQRHVPRALEAVCAKAMARDPHQRYPTALDLANDIENVLADEPVSCFREPLAKRITRWLSRHPATTLTLAVSAAVLVSVLVIVAIFTAST
jgi:serine/threonine protein kinase